MRLDLIQPRGVSDIQPHGVFYAHDQIQSASIEQIDDPLAGPAIAEGVRSGDRPSIGRLVPGAAQLFKNSLTTSTDQQILPGRDSLWPFRCFASDQNTFAK